MAVGWSPAGWYSDTTRNWRVIALAGCFCGMNRMGGGRNRVCDIRGSSAWKMVRWPLGVECLSSGGTELYPLHAYVEGWPGIGARKHVVRRTRGGAPRQAPEPGFSMSA